MVKNRNKNIDFIKERELRIKKYTKDYEWKKLSRKWLIKSFEQKYMYNFEYFGRPVIQTPVDIIALQEIIWKVKPDLIIETGIAHGGSIIGSASMLAMIDLCEAINLGKNLNSKKSTRKVLGIDIDIRTHNRKEIEKHPLSSWIKMIEGSSISEETVKKVHEYSKNYNNILIILDSNHTYKHVLAELNAYSTLTSINSYCIVFDTIIDDLPNNIFPDRAWGPKNNPKVAVKEFLKKHCNFKIDLDFEKKLLLTAAPNGYLKRIK